MSGQVALARRARPIITLIVGVVAVLAMTGVAFASIGGFHGFYGLPDAIARKLLVTSASLYGVIVVAITAAALWLARRNPLPRASAHWAMTAAAGMFICAVAWYAKPVWAFDIMSATDDGAGTHGVMHPTPEERMAIAQTLPPCSPPDLAVPTLPAWRWQTISPVAAQLPMPAEMREEPNEVPDDPDIQQWTLERWGNIVLERDDEAQQSSGFIIGSGAGTVVEPPCALRVGSSLVPVARTASTVRRRGVAGTDSMFTATTDVPVALPDTQLGVGITARTRAGRDTLLSILAAMQFVGREQRR